MAGCPLPFLLIGNDFRGHSTLRTAPFLTPFRGYTRCMKGGQCAFGRDVTDRTRAENQQAEAMKQLETIFETLQAGIVMISPQGKVTFANQHVADMFACPLEDLIGSSYSEHVHPVQLQAGDERMRRLLAGEIDHVHNQRHFIRPDGGDFWGHLSGRRLVDSRGNLVSLVGVIADISEMKQAEEELRRREQQFTSLADNLPDVVARFDRGYRRLCVNRRVEAMTGITARDFIGKTNQDLGMPPVQEWEDAVTRVFDSGEIAEIRVEFPTAAGMKYFESRIIPERGEDGSVETVVPGCMGGREAAALIRRLDPDAVLIVSSGYSNDPVMADHGRYGFNGSAVKPYTFETLLTELSQATAGPWVSP